jgi:hypothetical protein
MDLVDIYYERHNSVYKGIDISDLFHPEKGYALVPLDHRIIDRFNIPAFLSDQREFSNQDPTQLFVLGGFQAMGNPSSFHHPERRKFMVALYNYVAPLIAYSVVSEADAGMHYQYLSMIPDRFAVRRTDQQMMSETWHKDKSMTLPQSDQAFLIGGWVNLDKDQDQYFSCIPGDAPRFRETHMYYQSQLNADKGGFQGEKVENADERSVKVQIPPYHMILFNELLTHEVAKGPTKRKFDSTKNSYRCYIKWYISATDTPYWPAERFSNFLEDQTQIGMSYFQPDAPMYASAHTSTAISTLKSFSDQMIPEVKNFEFKEKSKYPGKYVDRFLGQGNSTKVKEGVQREGLRQWGLAFENYTERERAIYIPRKMI